MTPQLEAEALILRTFKENPDLDALLTHLGQLPGELQLAAAQWRARRREPCLKLAVDVEQLFLEGFPACPERGSLLRKLAQIPRPDVQADAARYILHLHARPRPPSTSPWRGY